MPTNSAVRSRIGMHMATFFRPTTNNHGIFHAESSPWKNRTYPPAIKPFLCYIYICIWKNMIWKAKSTNPTCGCKGTVYKSYLQIICVYIYIYVNKHNIHIYIYTQINTYIHLYNYVYVSIYKYIIATPTNFNIDIVSRLKYIKTMHPSSVLQESSMNILWPVPCKRTTSWRCRRPEPRHSAEESHEGFLQFPGPC